MILKFSKQTLEAVTVEALNQPDWPEFNLKRVMKKIASMQKDKSDMGGFDIEAAIKAHPDHLFVKVFAIKANEVNDNADYFSTAELKKAAHTFIGVPCFCNHQNDDIEKARGRVVHAWFDDDKDGIYIISMVDRVAYPKLARLIEEKHASGTSMGTSVEYSVCSICHNRASVADEYCGCVKERKNRKVSGTYQCRYHESSCKPEDNCPICGKSKDENKTFQYKEAHVFEHNYNLKFIEDSFVVNPACHDCLVEEILNASGMQQKFSNLREKISKLADAASCKTGACKIGETEMEKAAGRQEIDDLKDAMDKIERVAKSMFAQKDHVSIDYISELVEAMGVLQDTTDELIEMGYLQLPSPNIALNPSQTIAPPQIQQPTQPQFNMKPPEMGNANVGDLGTITKPKFSGLGHEKLKELKTALSNLNKRLISISSFLNTLGTENSLTTENKESRMANEKTSQSQASQDKTASQDTSVIIEKQLDNAKFTGERTELPNDIITEKQLDKPKDVNVTTSTSPQERLGSPDVIQEKQLEGAVSSGYVLRWGDFPAVITEKQWDDASRMIGSVLSKEQADIIGEKQLEDFRKNHKFVSPDVITEKQLAAANTDITKRWASSDYAKAIVKAAMDTLADAIAFYSKSPSEIQKAASFINDSIENKSKAAFAMLINSLPHKAETRTAEKQRNLYFSKIASPIANTNAVDAIIASAGEHVSGFVADDMVETIKHVASNEKAMAKVEALVKEKLTASATPVATVSKESMLNSAIAELDKPEDGLYRVDLTCKVAGITQDCDIDIDPTQKGNKVAFYNAVKKFASSHVDTQAEIIRIDLDEKNGLVQAYLKDVSALSEDEKKALAQFDPSDMDDESIFVQPESQSELETAIAEDETNDPTSVFDEDELAQFSDDSFNLTEDEMTPVGTADMSLVASKRETLKKQAQMFGGEMGGQGGASQAPGAGAPMPAATPNAMGQAPLESFEQSDASADFAEDTADDLTASPPGTKCPACGSDDVDMINGEGKCNNCGANQTYEIVIRVPNWPGVLESNKDSEKEETTEEGEGFELPEAGEDNAPAAPAAGMPAAAASDSSLVIEKFASRIRVKPEWIKKASKQFGTVSPLTGSTNTIKLASNGGTHSFVCLDTGTKYDVELLVKKDNPKVTFARWSWKPPVTAEGCSDCSRAKHAFIESLKAHGLTEEQFDSMTLAEKGKTILAMQTNGHMKQVKTASIKTSALSLVKEAFGVSLGDKFPVESCIERIARRYGENALALSGPCEGKSLAECVCNALKKADVYSHGLAMKVAEVWAEREASQQCLEDFIREGHSIKQASTICEGLKCKYASFDDVIAQELAELLGNDLTPPNGGGDGSEPADDFNESDMDVLADDDGETITLNLPLDIIEKIDEAIDIAKGENPAEEAHHQEGLPATDVAVEIPSDAADVVDEAADKVLDEQVEESTETVPSVDVTVVEDTNLPAEIADEVGEETTEDAVENEEKSDEVEENFEGENSDDSESDIADEGETFKEGETEESEETEIMAETTAEQLEKEATSLRRGKVIGQTGKITMDLSGVLSVLKKQAKAVSVETAQDAAEKAGVKVHGKSKIGDEEAFKADKFKDFSGKATMGEEDADLQKADKADVFTGNAKMGEEELDSELTDKATGGDKGQGEHTASTKSRLDHFAEAVLAQQKQVKRVNPQDDSDLGKITGDSFIGDEKASIGEVPAAKARPDNLPTTKDGFIGDEKASIGNKPTEKDTPSIPTKDDRIKGEKDNDKIKSEKTDQLVGIVNNNAAVASNESQSITKEALTLAGKMLAKGVITADQLHSKAMELSKIALTQLKDLEKAMFQSQKGLATGPDGVEGTPVIISEASRIEKTNPQDELVAKLSSMFRLHKQNELAEQDPMTNLRKNFR